ncbi:bifunctional phosphoglucose/phosphomannose isomerase, partial [candidate division KSB1 bacterium]
MKITFSDTRSTPAHGNQDKMWSQPVDINKLIKEYDRSFYLDFLTQFPDQIEKAKEIEIPIFKPPHKIRNGAVLGMGGSAIGGDLATGILADSLSVPISVIRGYEIPGWIGKDTLVVVSSYSGNTEETLSSFREALERGAMCVCMSTGGDVKTIADQNNLPVITLPKGYQPRAAVGFSLIPLLRLLDSLDLIINIDLENEINETISLLSNLNNKYSPNNGLSSPPAVLASRSLDKLPVIYTGSSPAEAIGTRWCGQIAEIAKMLAHHNTLPEMNHNEIMSWADDLYIRKDIMAIFLRDSLEQPRLKLRFDITREIVERIAGDTIELFAEGR